MYKKVISIAAVIGLVFFGGYLTAKQLVPKDSQTSTGPRYSTKAVERGDIKQGVNLSGQLNGNWGGSISAPKPEGVTDSNGSSVSVSYTVEEVFVEPNQMIKKGENLVRLSAANLTDILTELTDGIQKKQEEIQVINDNISKKTKALGDKINQDINSVYDVNAYNGIVVSSPIKGRLMDFTIEEGEKVENSHVATIVDDSMVKISFKVNTYEYESLQVGQKVLLQYRKALEGGGSQAAFDGFYTGTIKKLNSNQVPAGDAMTYVHNGVIEADNPGLVQKGMLVSIYTENNGLPVASLSYSGTVESYVNEEKVYTTLYSDNNRTVIATDVPVSENEFVEAGQTLVRIAGSDVTESIQQDVEEIMAEYDKVKAHNDEIDKIYKKIDKVTELTSKMMVTAPTDGMVAYVNYRAGDEIVANEQSDQWSLQLMDVYNTDEMNIYTTVSDLDVLYVSQDAPVTVTVDALPGETFDGKVMRLDQYTDRDGKTVYNVQISVEGREGLRPGMNTNCFVDSGESLDTLLVPIEAIFEENGKQKVEILLGENQVEIIDIETGLMNDMFVEVLSGLEEGQLVVTGSTKDLMPSQSVPENDSFLPGTNQ
ncbi:MAG: HlyD family efflux transporter periplasmic adaptor subunit [Tissierellia bacterium]|jgi:RND family efflux transporter MFP subunit|nr:HlyD family efflux transporter periplasmic adaptor subunit [Tissierellia bacterium]HKM00730.1 efflux RND transporter periplasmic adaptor subunit [Sedimentibacter sp.]